MQYRRLGRARLKVSVVGFGTAQLRLVPQQQALDTLKRGFSLGVNIVHTAPDYEGADALVAQAIAESGRKDIIVCSQGYGSREHLEWLFETTCRLLGKRRLEMFGIACVDDRELLGEKVWGPGSQVDFLLKKKQAGRIGAIFCTTHGGAEYIRNLIESDVFDAIMMAYNPLGFHLLSYDQKSRTTDRLKEFLPGNIDILPLAARKDIGVMLMKPLAGGLLCRGKAFWPHGDLVPDIPLPTSREILQFILFNHPEVSCVMPGTASVEEAQENAMAGHMPLAPAPNQREATLSMIRRLEKALCNRCGRCEALCGKGLPISWLFRDYYISNNRSMLFETPEQHHYRDLHPWGEPACTTCTDRTCRCPIGIDIPQALAQVHRRMAEIDDHKAEKPA